MPTPLVRFIVEELPAVTTGPLSARRVHRFVARTVDEPCSFSFGASTRDVAVAGFRAHFAEEGRVCLEVHPKQLTGAAHG